MKLEVINLVKKFGNITALNEVSFTVPSGEIFGFIGPNGAGKTTAMQIISGMDVPDSGDVLLDGVSAVDYPEKLRRSIGYMPDALPDAKDITVGEFIVFYASAFGLRGKARTQRINSINELTRLGELQTKFLNQLSKGMKQRVNLARILIHDPGLLLLDEPAAGLDPLTRIELRDILKGLAEQGKTVLLSSHILSELEDLVTGVVIIEKGRLVENGMLNDLITRNSSTDTLDTVCIDTIPGTVLGSWLSRIEELDGVRAVRAEKSRSFAVVIEADKIPGLLKFIAENNFPFASVRRTAYTASLEKIFISNTSGEVQ
ncbi:MAG: ABC transporter ATP-binding protein [Lentisphaeria bacterium]|nr:ABC transporter ATP-binding protein [Lentisphaeria bacterium]